MNAKHVNAPRTTTSRIHHDEAAKINVVCTTQSNQSEKCVDKNRSEGTKHEVKGAIKETVGKVTGNVGKQVAGNVEKNVGKVQHAVGKAADERRDADKKRRP